MNIMTDIEKILNEMTLDEKIGQLMQYNGQLFRNTAASITGPMIRLGLTEAQLDQTGSVLNFSTPLEARAIQDRHLEKDRHKIPMMFMMDVIHGFRTIYPIPLGMGASFDPALMADCCRMAAKEATAGGIHVTFAPMVDYVRDARWGRVMETCGEDPMLNSVMGAAQVRGFQGEDLRNPGTLMTCVKHFAGYGAAEAGRDYTQAELSEHLLREYYLPAYKACIDAGTPLLMPSFNVLNGVPSVANTWLMNDILREEWGYTGAVISDYNAIGELCAHGIAGNLKEAARMAMECGCDIDMCAAAYARHLRSLVEEGAITEAQIDASVRKVLMLKDRLGLFEDPYRGAAETEEPEVYLTEENRRLARRAAEESAVLLKNNGVLPFDRQVRRVAVIGPFADTHEIIGFWSCNGRNEESVTVAEGIRALLPEADVTVVRGCGCQWDEHDRSGFAEAVAAAKQADAVVLCLGEPQDYSGEGNCRTDLTLPGEQEALAAAVAEVNPNTAAVLFSGRPLVLTNAEKILPAMLCLWFPGTEGGAAAANLLFGAANPCGKLPMSFPWSTGQCPVYYNHTSTGRPKKPDGLVHQKYCSNYIDSPNAPLYDFGYGLSYSCMVYESMTLSQKEITPAEKLTVSVALRNEGPMDGKETVLLFMQDVIASNARPVQQLIAFEKVFLRAGERKTVTFEVQEPMLRFWNNRQKQVSEAGEFRLFTGNIRERCFETSFRLVK
jgi:beta-glucosidase